MLCSQPGLVAQSVTQAVARRSLDGILDVWDQCRHWSLHEGDRLNAVDIHDLLTSNYQGWHGRNWRKMSSFSRENLREIARSRVRAPLGTFFFRLRCLRNRVKTVVIDGCLHLSRMDCNIVIGVSMLFSWPLFNVCICGLYHVSLQKYSRKKSYIKKKFCSFISCPVSIYLAHT